MGGEGMTIDEAIQRYADNAEYERTHENLQGCLEFKQLVKWLKELRAYREIIEQWKHDQISDFTYYEH
jgi:hypothetical protein